MSLPITANGALQVLVYVVVVLAFVKPLGLYMAAVYERRRLWLDPILGPLERLSYRLAGVRPDEEMNWKTYAGAVLVFHVVGLLCLYWLQRLQGVLPLNPQSFGAVAPDLAFNTGASFVTNTNWQAYGGETTMSYLTQMAGLTVQNFASAGAGMAIAIALIRGFARRSAPT